MSTPILVGVFCMKIAVCVVVEMSKIRRISTVFLHPMCTQGPVCAPQTQRFAMGNSKEAHSHDTSIQTQILVIFVVLAC